MSIVTAADLTEFQVRAHLDSGGFLGAFTDIFGGSQEAPEVQVGFYEDTRVAGKKRILLIRSSNSGGPSDDLYRIENVTIALVGLAVYSDWLIVKGRAAQMHRWLLENFKSDCIINFDDINDVTGPFLTESNRPVAELNFTLTLER